MSYLRDAEPSTYEKELKAVWADPSLRDHLRHLVIEFLGQQVRPSDAEELILAPIFKRTSPLRMAALRAIAGSPGWFERLKSSVIPEAMRDENPSGANLAPLMAAWHFAHDDVLSLVRNKWYSDPNKDTVTWLLLEECPSWDDSILQMATTILRRTHIDAFRVGYLASKVAVTLPTAGFALVRAALDRSFEQVVAKHPHTPLPPFPEAGSIEEQREWFKQRPSKHYRELIEHQTNYYDLPEMAKLAPGPFLEAIWPWYLRVLEILREEGRPLSNYRYVGDESLFFNVSRSFGESPPLIKALFEAVEALATNAPDTFRAWVAANQSIELLTVQRLIARGFLSNVESYVEDAADFLLSDSRRLMLGNSDDRFSVTKALITAIIPKLPEDRVRKLEEAVLSFQSYPRLSDATPEQRRVRLKSVRSDRLRLLRAFPANTLSSDSARLVREEERALQSPPDWDARMEGFGSIGSPMSASAMAKARDEEILKILDEVDDKTDWDHPRDWMRGGSIQLSREFAEFTKAEPYRATRIVRLLKPGRQERAAAHAIQAISGASYDPAIIGLPPPSELAVELVRDLANKGFGSEEYRQTVANAITQLVRRGVQVPDDLIALLEGWLAQPPDSQREEAQRSRDEHRGSKPSDVVPFASSEQRKQEETVRSILWDDRIVTLPHGNYPILEAISHALLSRRPPEVDRWRSAMEDHIGRSEDPTVWAAILRFLPHLVKGDRIAGANFIGRLFETHQELVETDEAVTLIAHAQAWVGDERLRLWLGKLRASQRSLSQQAYGELIGLLWITRHDSDSAWVGDQVESLSSVTEERSANMRVGMGYAAANLWSEIGYREKAGELLARLIPQANSDIAKAIFAVFLSVDRLNPDGPTVRLLQCLLDHPQLIGLAGNHFLVEKLQTLLPYEADLVGRLAVQITDLWSSSLTDVRTSISAVAPELVNLALTLHRLGGSARNSGLILFEKLLDIGAHGARKALDEIDNRLSAPRVSARPTTRRIARRRGTTRR